ncbi:MAG: hypothetical protein ACWGPR_12655 [Candidatus Deferrimicrobiaceae bacterium]
MAHPPDEPDAVACSADAPGGEAKNAWVAPDAVVPAPATWPKSFTAAASVVSQPGKERISNVPPDRRKLRIPSGESPYPATVSRLLTAMACEEVHPGGVMETKNGSEKTNPQSVPDCREVTATRPFSLIDRGTAEVVPGGVRSRYP